MKGKRKTLKISLIFYRCCLAISILYFSVIFSIVGTCVVLNNIPITRFGATKDYLWSHMINFSYSKIPIEIRNHYVQNGWTFYLDDADMLLNDEEEDYMVTGYLNYKQKRIVLAVPTKKRYTRIFTASTVVHEMGHYVDYTLMSPSLNDDDFINAFTEERSLFVEAFPTSVGHNTSTQSEYFAEAYQKYITNPSCLKESCPLTYEYMEDANNKMIELYYKTE